MAVKDRDLGVEVISFVDDPTNAISSADLVNGEFLTTDKNLKLSPMVMSCPLKKESVNDVKIRCIFVRKVVILKLLACVIN